MRLGVDLRATGTFPICVVKMWMHTAAAIRVADNIALIHMLANAQARNRGGMSVTMYVVVAGCGAASIAGGALRAKP